MRNIRKMLFILPGRNVLPVSSGRQEFTAINVLKNQLTFDFKTQYKNMDKNLYLIQEVQDSQDSIEKIHTLNFLTEEMLLHGNIGEAEKNLSAALELCLINIKEARTKSTHYFVVRSAYVETLSRKAMLQQVKGEFIEAVKTHQKALIVQMEITGEELHPANWPTHANLAMAHLVVNECDRAIQIYKKQPQIISQSMRMFPAMAIEEGKINCAIIHHLKNEISLAEDHFFAALEKLPKKANIGTAIVQFNLYQLYKGKEDFSAAHEYLELAKVSFRQLPGLRNFQWATLVLEAGDNVSTSTAQRF
jgi:tetratricopeptide (TPR) repeat protein